MVLSAVAIFWFISLHKKPEPGSSLIYKNRKIVPFLRSLFSQLLGQLKKSFCPSQQTISSTPQICRFKYSSKFYHLRVQLKSSWTSIYGYGDWAYSSHCYLQSEFILWWQNSPSFQFHFHMSSSKAASILLKVDAITLRKQEVPKWLIAFSVCENRPLISSMYLANSLLNESTIRCFYTRSILRRSFIDNRLRIAGIIECHLEILTYINFIIFRLLFSRNNSICMKQLEFYSSQKN